jgi:ethanolamine transporter EutH
MLGRNSLIRTGIILPFIVLLFLPATVSAQEVVAKEILEEWFYSRLLLGVVVGIIVGLIIGLIHLCRLQFAISGALNINSQARRRLMLSAGIIFVIGALLLFLDAWLLYPFSDISLNFWDALTQVWLNYRMLLILFAMLGVFALIVAIATRFKSDCRCRYAFIPGPRGK